MSKTRSIDAAALISRYAPKPPPTRSPPQQYEPRTLAEAMAVIRHQDRVIAMQQEQIAGLSDFVHATARGADDRVSISKAVRHSLARGLRRTPQTMRNWCDKYRIGAVADGKYEVSLKLLNDLIDDLKRSGRV